MFFINGRFNLIPQEIEYAIKIRIIGIMDRKACRTDSGGIISPKDAEEQ